MAPRKQTKQAAAESVAAAADGSVTPPKKRKTPAKPADEPRQAKGRNRQANKQEDEVAGELASSPKKLRSRQNKQPAADTTTTAAVKNDTKSKPKRKTNKEPENAEVDNHASEEVAEKKTRGGKTVATAKKAGTKAAAVKPKAKVPVARKQKTPATDEDSAVDSGKKNVAGKSPVKRTTRRVKAVKENDAPTQSTAKVSRKRKNVEDEAVTEAQVPKEKEKEEEEEDDENKIKAVASKKPRGRAKKMETDDAPTTSKRRPKKNPAKEVVKPPPEEAEVKKHNDKEKSAAIQEDNSKTKNVKNTKKGNTRKAAPRGKLNAVEEKITDEAQSEEVATLEVDVKENGEALITELKQKKKNVGKANAAMNGKVEAKGKQKKGQAAAASVDEEETTKDESVEITNEITEMNATLIEIDQTDIKDVSFIKNDGVSQNEEDEEENEANESKADSTKDGSNTETSIKETERSGSFLCFP